MFKIAINPHFWAPVVAELIGDMGQPIEASFKCQYRRLTVEEFDALLQRVRAGDVTDAQVLDQVLMNWDGLADEAGNPLPFTPDNMNRVGSIFRMRAAMVTAFFDAHLKAPAKNSVAPLATTSAA